MLTVALLAPRNRANIDVTGPLPVAPRPTDALPLGEGRPLCTTLGGYGPVVLGGVSWTWKGVGFPKVAMRKKDRRGSVSAPGIFF